MVKIEKLRDFLRKNGIQTDVIHRGIHKDSVVLLNASDLPKALRLTKAAEERDFANVFKSGKKTLALPVFRNTKNRKKRKKQGKYRRNSIADANVEQFKAFDNVLRTLGPVRRLNFIRFLVGKMTTSEKKFVVLPVVKEVLPFVSNEVILQTIRLKEKGK